MTERERMPKDPFDEVARLHANIHRDDPPPDNEREEQAAVVMSRMQAMLQTLIMEGVPPTTLELTLFYNWVRLTTLIQGFGEEKFEECSRDMVSIRKSLVAVLERAAEEIEDTGPTESMRELGQKLQQMKEMYRLLAAQKRTREEVERHTDMAVHATFGVAGECLNDQIHPSLIQRLFLYYWLRTSVINANVSEEFFQKIERTWEEVMDRVDTFVDDFWGRP